MQASLTDLENFQAAVTAIDPTVVFNTDDHCYIRLEFTRPDNAIAKYALTDMLTKLAHAHRLHFDGYDEDGYPCFINEGDL